MGGLRALFVAWRGLPPVCAETLDGWRPVPLMVRGQVAAVALLAGTEIHFAADPAWHGRIVQRQRARDFLAPLIDWRGFLTTRSVGDDDDRFLSGMGFVRTWDEGNIKHWMLTALPFEKA